jgi:uncharacterized membrane protein YkvA (DUF1232 family)
MVHEIRKIRDGLSACPWWVKIVVALGILYLLNPIDLIPDFIPVIGVMDDVALVLVLSNLVRKYADTKDATKL